MNFLFISPIIFFANKVYSYLNRVIKRREIDLTNENVITKAFWEYSLMQTGAYENGRIWNKNNVHEYFKDFVAKYGLEVTDLINNALVNADQENLFTNVITKLSPIELTHSILYPNIPHYNKAIKIGLLFDVMKTVYLQLENLNKMLIYIGYAANAAIEKVSMVISHHTNERYLLESIKTQLKIDDQYLLESIKTQLEIAAQGSKLAEVFKFENSEHLTLLEFLISSNELAAIKIILDIAAQNGKLVEVLNLKDSMNWTPLKYAINFNKLEAIKIILDIAAQNGKLVDVLNFIENSSIVSPLTYAIKFNKLEAIQAILEIAAQHNKLTEVLTFKDSLYWLPLEYAVYYGTPGVIKTILDIAAQHDKLVSILATFNNIGETLIKFVLNKVSLRGYKRDEALKEIIDIATKYNKIDEVLCFKDKKGQPIFSEKDEKQPEILKIWLNEHNNTFCRNKEVLTTSYKDDSTETDIGGSINYSGLTQDLNDTSP